MTWKTCLLCGCLCYHGKYCRPCISKNSYLQKIKRKYPYRYKDKVKDKVVNHKTKRKEHCIDYIKNIFKWIYNLFESILRVKC